MKKTKLSSTIVWLGLIVAIILMATNTKAANFPEKANTFLIEGRDNAR